MPPLDGDPLPFEKDPKVPTRSYLRITPWENPDGYVCFAKNHVGHSKTPCVFHLDVIGMSLNNYTLAEKIRSKVEQPTKMADSR